MAGSSKEHIKGNNKYVIMPVTGCLIIGARFSIRDLCFDAFALICLTSRATSYFNV